MAKDYNGETLSVSDVVYVPCVVKSVNDEPGTNLIVETLLDNDNSRTSIALPSNEVVKSDLRSEGFKPTIEVQKSAVEKAKDVKVKK